MNQKLKYLGLVAILLVLSAALTVESADAKTITPQSELQKKIVGDKICGDKLCSEIGKTKRATD